MDVSTSPVEGKGKLFFTAAWFGKPMFFSRVNFNAPEEVMYFSFKNKLFSDSKTNLLSVVSFALKVIPTSLLTTFKFDRKVTLSTSFKTAISWNKGLLSYN